MKKTVLIVILAGVIVIAGLYAGRKYGTSGQRNGKTEINDGDIIFQTSLSSQSKAIQLATKSKYSHCGIIYRTNGKYYVFEAVQPVKLTPLDRWIARGENGHYVVKRLKDAGRILTKETLAKIKREGEKFMGKDYDLAFDWSDSKIYCSELIWKIYQRAAAVEIGKLEKLGDFDLTNELVRQKIEERYDGKIPVEQTVISPAAIFASKRLITVMSD